MPLITGPQLKSTFTTLSTERSEILARIINELGPQYGVTKKTLPAFLANVGVESGEFSKKSESLNYSAQALKDTFSYYRLNPALADVHGRTPKHTANQVLIGNTVYWDQNRSANRKLGNDLETDGFKYRGGSFAQLTGKAVFVAFAKYKKVPVEIVEEQIRQSDTWSMQASLWFFAAYKSLLDEAERGDIRSVCLKWAGSEMGYAERIKYYNRAKKALAE